MTIWENNDIMRKYNDYKGQNEEQRGTEQQALKREQKDQNCAREREFKRRLKKKRETTTKLHF